MSAVAGRASLGVDPRGIADAQRAGHMTGRGAGDDRARARRSGPRPTKAAPLKAARRGAKLAFGKPQAPRKGKKRSKGRPHDPESAVGREALIRATRELLKTMPPAKVTRLDIARHAGVDPSLIRYYFGDKSRLMAEVVVLVLTDMRAARAKRASTSDAAERLKIRLADSVHLFQEHPHHYQLVVEQIFSGAAPKVRAMWGRDIVQAGVEELRSIIEEGIKAGQFRSVEPRFLHLLIVAAGEFYASGRAVLEDLFGPAAVDAKLERAYIEFLFDLLVNGLARR
jgi:TetR/AcrR family transcriptional regulator